ncbi:LysE family translocator [Serratia liquefaciens]|uniref:LysE family translocator n=1 Tax=Serratia liquefaciens TaxID=614 RepID=UPI0003583CC5|nr:LysE family transporter [Serratia liquefaciens]AGQ30035.1 threonine transporter [Serratia liquefaciens ATCC 27592]CAI0941915.1 Threonine efflux protein [Serratia liquefaciens]CAI2112487.1 Threonine efflux protein [Serratia liquefaciens]CAI2465355.1 Threonine efflux protein [Serratia liquefaciens]HBL6728421.1 LysE family transporter [Serratia liquefaciens]
MISETALSVLSITGAIALGAMSPGQSFILVARTAVASSRRDGMAVALGMGVGCFIFALVALLGLQSLLLALPWLYSTLKVLGGAYLVYLAFKMLRGASQPLNVEAVGAQSLGFCKAFTTGLLTQLSNPNTAIVFGSVFAALLSHKISPLMYIILPVIALTVDVLWYAFVAFVLSSPRPRRAYLRFKAWFDRVGGGVLALLGVKLMLNR